MAKLGFLGGSFDPVHFGHVLGALAAAKEQGLDRVFLVPAARAPLKPVEDSTAADRLGMLQAILPDYPGLEISDHELSREGESYTIDTLRHFRKAYPADKLYWIIGSDQLAKLPLWKEASNLGQFAEFICLDRPGYGDPAPEMDSLRIHRMAGPRLPLSSTQVRDRIRRGQAVEDLIPHKALVYVRQKGLYRNQS